MLFMTYSFVELFSPSFGKQNTSMCFFFLAFMYQGVFPTDVYILITITKRFVDVSPYSLNFSLVDEHLHL